MKSSKLPVESSRILRSTPTFGVPGCAGKDVLLRKHQNLAVELECPSREPPCLFTRSPRRTLVAVSLQQFTQPTQMQQSMVIFFGATLHSWTSPIHEAPFIRGLVHFFQDGLGNSANTRKNRQVLSTHAPMGKKCVHRTRLALVIGELL